MRSWHYEFDPHPKQQAALQSPAREILYGGSVYSGKSEVLLAACIDLCTMVPNAMALLIRRTTDEQRELKRRILARLPTYIAKLNRSENTFYFFNGSQLVMRFLDSEDDATKVQGFEAQLACVERSTPVLMADGTWQRIDTIRPGDSVATLQGPQKVLRSMSMGRKEVARVTTERGSSLVAMDHRLLTADGWDSPGELIPTQSRPEPALSALSPGSSPAAAMPPGSIPPGLPPRRARLPQSPADTLPPGTPAWSVSDRNGNATSHETPRVGGQPQEWSGPVVLYGPDLRSDRGYNGPSHGVGCARKRSSIQGSTPGYPTSPHYDDALSRTDVAPGQESTPSLAGAASHTPPRWHTGESGNTPGRNPGARIEYDHPYTGQRVTSSEDSYPGQAHMAPAGEAEVWDLEVAEANHYVSSGQIIVQNCFDELTHYDQPWYAEVVSRLRATGQVKADMDRLGFVPRALSASNPGGRGHSWVKQRFIDPAPANKEFIGDDNTHRLFLQATIWDNPYADVEDYIQNSLGPLDPERKQALLYGNWDVLKGVRFSQWRRGRHVISPDDFPPSMLSGERVISVDYGFDAPFAAVWLNKLPNGLTVVYRELYATDLTAIQQAELIKSMTTPEEWEQGVTVIMDPSMWGRRDASAPKTQNPLAPSVSSPAHDYQTVLGLTPRKANNERVMGAARIDEKLRVHTDGWPRLLVYDTCLDLIRTLPALMRSKVRPEDIQQNPKQEDHLYDALRYGLMYLEGKSPVATGEDDRRPTPGTLTGGLAAKKW